MPTKISKTPLLSYQELNSPLAPSSYQDRYADGIQEPGSSLYLAILTETNENKDRSAVSVPAVASLVPHYHDSC